ncbi:uncharacterized protein LOC107038946 [Diachasma alloeum]|nr:uncharacterized protein LOC107038946 [Diachasma alloeum]
MGLALLEPTAINEAFQNLINETERDILLYFDGFLRYYRRWWINTVKPANFSVFGFHERTNNAIESYHRVLTLRIGLHPNIWTFIEKLLKLQKITRIEILSLQRGRSVRRPREHQYIVRDELIETAWQMYDRNELDNAKFLTATSHILGGFGKKFVICEPGQLAMFQNDLTYQEIVNIFGIP